MEVSKDENAEFHEWVKILPNNCNSYPAFFNLDEMKTLEGSSIVKHINETNEKMKNNYEILKNEISSFDFSYDEYKKTIYLILSRAFTFKGGETEGYAMVPLLDMLNHSKNSNVDQIYNFDLKGYELIAKQNIN